VALARLDLDARIRGHDDTDTIASTPPGRTTARKDLRVGNRCERRPLRRRRKCGARQAIAKTDHPAGGDKTSPAPTSGAFGTARGATARGRGRGVSEDKRQRAQPARPTFDSGHERRPVGRREHRHTERVNVNAHGAAPRRR
jgi:hypothetical protein